MGRNIGGLDRLLRLGIGVPLVMMAVFGPLGFWAFLGLYPLVTGVMGVDPVYAFAGMDTSRRGAGQDGAAP
jgi:hypothetical protein